MVALCDVDEGRLDGAGKRFPKAKRFADFRKMLYEMEKQIDGVTVCTPDHCHAAAAALAMTMGKACFVQTPLAHTVYEARTLGQLARKIEGRHPDGEPGDGLRHAPPIGGDVAGRRGRRGQARSTSGPAARSGPKGSTAPSRRRSRRA